MALNPFIFDDFYQLTTGATPPPPSSPVTMDLIFGSLGQSADYTLMIGATTVFHDEKVSHTDIPLGDTLSLAGKILTVVGNIIDMPGTDDSLTLTFNIKGGVNPLTQSFSVAATTGDNVAISITVHFI